MAAPLPPPAIFKSVLWENVLILRPLPDDIITSALQTARSSDEFNSHLHEQQLQWEHVRAVRNLARSYSDVDISESLFFARRSYGPNSITIPSHVPISPVTNLTSTHRPSNPPYWCTVCPNRPYGTRDAWMKHEKGHERWYQCKLGGPERDPPICETAGDAVQRSPCSYRTSRRDEMVNHLCAVHELQGKTNAQKRAGEFETVSGKRYWSCGFCVCLFDSYIDRLKHLGDHFEKEAKTRDHWSLSIVIEGLLRQDVMAQAWSRQLADHRDQYPFWQSSETTTKFVDRLQLGISDTPTAASVAKILYDASNHSQGTGDHIWESSAINPTSEATDGESQFFDYAMNADRPDSDSQEMNFTFNHFDSNSASYENTHWGGDN